MVSLSSLVGRTVAFFMDVDVKGFAESVHRLAVNEIAGALEFLLSPIDAQVFVRSNGKEGGLHVYSSTFTVLWDPDAMTRFLSALGKVIIPYLFVVLTRSFVYVPPQNGEAATERIEFDVPRVWGLPGFSKSGAPNSWYSKRSVPDNDNDNDAAVILEPLVFPVDSAKRTFGLETDNQTLIERVAVNIEAKLSTIVSQDPNLVALVSAAQRAIAPFVSAEGFPDHLTPRQRFDRDLNKRKKNNNDDENVEFRMPSLFESQEDTFVTWYTVLPYEQAPSFDPSDKPAWVKSVCAFHLVNYVATLFNTKRHPSCVFFRDVDAVVQLLKRNQRCLRDVVVPFVVYGVYKAATDVGARKIKTLTRLAVNIVYEMLGWTDSMQDDYDKHVFTQLQNHVSSHFGHVTLGQWYRQYHTVASLSLCVLLQTAPTTDTTFAVGQCGDEMLVVTDTMYSFMVNIVQCFIECYDALFNVPTSADTTESCDGMIVDDNASCVSAASARRRRTTPDKPPRVDKSKVSMLIKTMFASLCSVLDYYFLAIFDRRTKEHVVWLNGWTTFTHSGDVALKIKYEQFIESFFDIMRWRNMSEKHIVERIDMVKSFIHGNVRVGSVTIWGLNMPNILKWDCMRIVCFGDGDFFNIESKILSTGSSRHPFAIFQSLSVNMRSSDFFFAFREPELIERTIEYVFTGTSSNDLPEHPFFGTRRFKSLTYYLRRVVVWATGDIAKAFKMLLFMLFIFTRRRKTYLHLHGAKANNGKTSYLESLLDMFGSAAAGLSTKTLIDDTDDKKPDLADAAVGAMLTYVDDIHNMQPKIVNKLTGWAPYRARRLFDNGSMLRNQSVLVTTSNTSHDDVQDAALQSRLRQLEFSTVILSTPPEERRGDSASTSQPVYDLQNENDFIVVLEHLRAATERGDDDIVVHLFDPMCSARKTEKVRAASIVAGSLLLSLQVNHPHRMRQLRSKLIGASPTLSTVDTFDDDICTSTSSSSQSSSTRQTKRKHSDDDILGIDAECTLLSPPRSSRVECD